MLAKFRQGGADWESAHSTRCLFCSSHVALNLSNDRLQQIEFENVSTISSHVCLRNKCQLLPVKKKEVGRFTAVDGGAASPIYAVVVGATTLVDEQKHLSVILGQDEL